MEPAQTMQEAQACRSAVTRAARLLGDHWTLLIIRDLEGGCRRFQQLLQSTGMSPGVLSGRLRMMERVGLVSRRQYSEIPPRVEYTLTEKGAAVLPIVEQLRIYGERWLTEDEEAEATCDAAV